MKTGKFLTSVLVALVGCHRSPTSTTKDPVPSDAKLFSEYSGFTDPDQLLPQIPVTNPPSVEQLYEEWTIELRSGFVGIHVNPDGSRCLIGPGFSDQKYIATIASAKRLAAFKPKLDLVNYCKMQYDTGDPIAGLVGYVMDLTYPGKLPKGVSAQKMLEEAKRLAEAEEK